MHNSPGAQSGVVARFLLTVGYCYVRCESVCILGPRVMSLIARDALRIANKTKSLCATSYVVLAAVEACLWFGNEHHYGNMTLSQPVVSYYTRGKFAILQLNKPRRLNALSLSEFYDLANALYEIDRLRNVVVTVLTGTGRFFSA